MIPNTAVVCHKPQEQETSPWQKDLARAVRDPRELLALLGLVEQDFPSGLLSGSHFPLRVPHSYITRMQPGNPRDPLLLQVLPRGEEHLSPPGYLPDPVGDADATVMPGLLHKYQGRVLLMASSSCPVHCRYCFRRHFPYSDNHLHEAALQDAVSYIQADQGIHEVILSGGDPLNLANHKLQALTDRLTQCRHIKRLRIHSRMPVVLPSRVDEGLLAWLRDLPWSTVLVLHCNHARELDDELRQALGKLQAAGVTLLNQAVLLKGINDSARAQRDLAEDLFGAGVLPYYLHLLDPVQGAAHFEVDASKARELLHSLRQHLPGYLVPKLVQERAGEAYKLPLE